MVPISLCRAGGCGVSTSSSGGVKFDFDDDDEDDARDNLNANSAPPIPGMMTYKRSSSFGWLDSSVCPLICSSKSSFYSMFS